MEIRKYIRDRKGNRVGVIVSNTRNSVGWALCATSHGDKFDLDIGLKIARGREAAGTMKDIPSSIREEVARMIDRSRQYFKN